MTGEGKTREMRAMVLSALNCNGKLEEILEKIDMAIYEMERGDQNPRHPMAAQIQQACRFHVTIGSDGRGTISVDDVLEIKVPPVPARLAQVLAMDAGDMSSDCAEGPFVPYKTVPFMIEHMRRLLGRDFTESALKQAVYRLRKILAGRGCAGLLETNKFKTAYRVRLRRTRICAAAAL